MWPGHGGSNMGVVKTRWYSASPPEPVHGPATGTKQCPERAQRGNLPARAIYMHRAMHPAINYL